MINAGILDGDTVIIQEADTANTGEIVVALVDNQEATLKRLRRRGDSIALEAANPAYETRLYGADRVRFRASWWALSGVTDTADVCALVCEQACSTAVARARLRRFRRAARCPSARWHRRRSSHTSKRSITSFGPLHVAASGMALMTMSA